jgi:hypothetical protein
MTKKDRTYKLQARRTFTLCDGQQIPKGAIIEAKVKAFHSGNVEFFDLEVGPFKGAVPCINVVFYPQAYTREELKAN